MTNPTEAGTTGATPLSEQFADVKFSFAENHHHKGDFERETSLAKVLKYQANADRDASQNAISFQRKLKGDPTLDKKSWTARQPIFIPSGVWDARVDSLGPKVFSNLLALDFDPDKSAKRKRLLTDAEFAAARKFLASIPELVAAFRSFSGQGYCVLVNAGTAENAGSVDKEGYEALIDAFTEKYKDLPQPFEWDPGAKKGFARPRYPAYDPASKHTQHLSLIHI